MFTIDLLKGESIPIKSKPEGIAAATATFAVPVIVAIVMFGFYLINSIAISIQKQEIVNYETKTNELSDAVELQKSFEKEENVINSSLSEVSSSIGRHTQWSPVLVTLAENMPDSMVLTNLEVEQRFVRSKVPKKDDPQTMVNINVPVRTLRLSVSGKPQDNWEEAVRDFRDRLRFSTVLGPKLEDIRVSQHVEKDVVCYEIDCIFKPGL